MFHSIGESFDLQVAPDKKKSGDGKVIRLLLLDIMISIPTFVATHPIKDLKHKNVYLMVALVRESSNLVGFVLWGAINAGGVAILQIYNLI